MKRMIPVLSALVVGAMTSAAAAAVTVVYDKSLAAEFAAKRQIIEKIQQEFGKYAAYDTAQNLPARINQQIVPGHVLPADAPTKPVPEKLGQMPKLVDNSHWVAIGNHLVEVTPDNRIVMVVYDALP